jgi:hypothetical protein
MSLVAFRRLYIFWTGLKMKNPDAPAAKREAEEDWGRNQRAEPYV